MPHAALDLVHPAPAQVTALELAPGGGYAVARSDRDLHVVDRASGATTVLPAPDLYACLADELVTLARVEGSAWQVVRFASDGRVVAPPCTLLLEGRPTLVAGAAVALIRGHAGYELRGAGPAFAVTPVTTTDDAVPLAPRSRIERREGRLILRRPGGDVALELAPNEVLRTTPLAAALVFSGTALAIDLASGAARQIALVDARRGTLLSRLRFEAVDRISIVANLDRLVVRRADELTVIDLRTRRVLGVHPVPAGTALAFESQGRWAAIADDRGIEIVAFHEIVRARVRAITAEHEAEHVLESGSGSEPGPGPEPEPEPEPEPDLASPSKAPEEPAPPAPIALRAPPAPIAPPADDLAPRRAALASARLIAFEAGTSQTGLSASDRRDLGDAWFELVAAASRRALAGAWDSGRITTDRGSFPYEIESAAVLDRARGRAPEQVVQASERETAAMGAFSAWNRAGAPHVELARAFELSPLATLILLFAAAPQVWPELGRAYAIVAGDPSRAFCDEHLLALLLDGAAPRGAIAAELDDAAPLVRHGLVLAGAGQRPFRTVTAPRALVQRLLGAEAAGDDHVAPRDATVTLDAIRAPLPGLEALVAALGRAPSAAVRVILRGRRGSGRRTLAAALAERAGRRLGVIEPGDAPALSAGLRAAAVRGWLPCVCLDPTGLDAAARAAIRAVLDRHPGPVIVRLDSDAHALLAPGALELTLAPLDHRARVTAWTDALAHHGLAAGGVDALAARFSVGPGTIAQVVARIAEAGAGADDLAHRLEDEVRAERAVGLRGVASRVERLPSWNAVILPPDTHDAVRGFVSRVRHRRRVLEDWGMQAVAPSARGLTALFQGAPGTGKTLVAGAIARELGYELYRIDLSQVMSKWLGETEKNLAAAFAAAEQGECVLLFDEADSLFTRRTEVRSSNDRYANLEVNYLLQRLDEFEGIAILTTNFGSAIDPAFRRRMSVRVTFPFPDEETRRDLWRAHLPATMPLAGDLDLDELARRFQLSGGYIRNAALRAAHIAADENCSVTAELLVRAVRLELTEMGKLGDGGIVE